MCNQLTRSEKREIKKITKKVKAKQYEKFPFTWHFRFAKNVYAFFFLRSKAFFFSIITISSSATRKAKQISTKLTLIRHKAKWSVNTSRNTSLLQYRYFKDFFSSTLLGFCLDLLVLVVMWWKCKWNFCNHLQWDETDSK